jgi:MFS transporter, OFA family, oxalate/formate antiporter
LKPHKIFYGWWIVAASVAIAVYTAAVVFYGFTAFFQPMVDDLGWSYTTVSLGASLQGIESGLMAPLVGTLIDRWGPRRIIFFGAISLSLGMFLLSRSTTLLSFYTAFAFIAMGTSSCSMTALVTTVANWFNRRIGLASGIATCGFGLCGIMLPVIVRLIDVYEWRTAMAILALGALLLIAPLSLLFRHKPEQYGYLPDGDPPGAIDEKVRKNAAESTVALVEEPSYGIRQALKSRVFWHIALAYACYHVTTAAVVIHVMPYLGSLGISRSLAGLVAMGVPLSSVVGRLGMGWVADRFERKKVTMVGFAMMGLGLICFEGVAMAGIWLVLPFLLLFCLGYGGNNTMRVALIRDLFGRSNYGGVFGLLMGISTIGSFLGPPLAGRAFDIYGSYQNVWFVVAGFAFASMLFIWTIPGQMKAENGI